VKYSEKQKVIIALAVFGLVLGGLLVMNVLKFNHRSELLARIDALRGEEEKATAKIKRIPELREKRANLATIINQYAEILPKEEHTQHDAFVEIIDSYRKDTQIVIQRTEYLKPKTEADDGKTKRPKENFMRHRYRFKLVGTVPDFLRFINKIENHIRFLKIDAISIKPLGASEESSSDIDERSDTEEIAKARIPFKDIEVTVSTYTYSKGEGEKK
jgi:hypothetical protein